MLASSSERDDREYAATALRDIAYIKPAALRPQVVERLMQDADTTVQGIAREIPLIRNESEHSRRQAFYASAPFSRSGAMTGC
ncbi:MAG: hypothetical protein ACREXY_06755 [Gammaproteobacteria bacterium]